MVYEMKKIPRIILVLLIACGQPSAGELKSEPVIIGSNPNSPYGPDDGDRVGDTRYEASSYLIEAGKPDDTYAPDSVSAATYIEGTKRYGKAWCEGVKGPGINEWIKINFTGEMVQWDRLPKSSIAYKNHLHELHRLRLANGFVKNKTLYYANNRVKKLLVEFSSGEKFTLNLKDGMDWSPGYPVPMIFRLNRIQAKWVKFTILEVYKGKKYDDTCLADLVLESDDWGTYLKNGSYILTDRKNFFIEMLNDKYGGISQKQTLFVESNVNKKTGYYAIDKINYEIREGKIFKNASEILRRMCEINQSIELPPCVHPEWIDQ